MREEERGSEGYRKGGEGRRKEGNRKGGRKKGWVTGKESKERKVKGMEGRI